MNFFENNNLEILFNYDSAYLGKYNIMCYICKLVLCYGKYNYGEIMHDSKYTQKMTHSYNSGTDYLNLSKIWSCWSESPEVQLFEHVLNYVYLNNISYEKISCNFPFTGAYLDRYSKVNWDIN